MGLVARKVPGAFCDRKVGQICSLGMDTSVSRCATLWELNLAVLQKCLDPPQCHASRPSKEAGFRLPRRNLWGKPAAQVTRGQLFRALCQGMLLGNVFPAMWLRGCMYVPGRWAGGIYNSRGRWVVTGCPPKERDETSKICWWLGHFVKDWIKRKWLLCTK